MTTCKLCGKKLGLITDTHLRAVHGSGLGDYVKRFGSKNCGFLSPNLLPKTDIRYLSWRESLRKRPAVWSMGFTKETHPSVLKISQTFKNKKIDNFAKWRARMIKDGLIVLRRPPFKRSGNLAELTGTILGDGHIGKFPRTEVLMIVSNSNNPGFVKRYAMFVQDFFRKKPYVIKKSDSNCIRITIYQKEISKRLGIPSGSRRNKAIAIPKWIWRNKNYLRRYLRGLYEAEGSYCVHEPTYTYKFLFSNRNKSLLDNVYCGLKKLGFHPHRSKYQIQISKKTEVKKAVEYFGFRKY